MIINNKAELIDELKKNGGKVYILSPYFMLINNVAIHNTEDCDIEMVYTDLDMLDSEDSVIEFCDSYGMLIFSVKEMDLFDFEILFEYDKDGRIMD